MSKKNRSLSESIVYGSFAMSVVIAIMTILAVVVCVMIIIIPNSSANGQDISEPIAVEEIEIMEENDNISSIISEAHPEENSSDPNPYDDLELSFEEKELLACMAYNESRGEPFEGQVAVIQVALNRYMHEAYSGSISDILLTPNQFSVGSTYTEDQMRAVEAALAGDPVLGLNTDVVYFSAGGLTYGTYYCTIGGHVFRTYH